MSRAKQPAYRYPTNVEVRAWATERYYDVPQYGTLPQWVIDEWNRTHRKRKYVKEHAHHGTTTGFTYHKCRQACCRKAWNAYQERRAA